MLIPTRLKWLLPSSLLFAGLIVWLFIVPLHLFRDIPCSTVVEARDGQLMGARVADDGQWRFPAVSEVPQKYSRAVIEFEDRYFKYHPGVNPISIAKALARNIRAGHIVSGGSTITMQVIRLSRSRQRKLSEKIIEAGQAIRLDLRYSKDEILALYASYAPFGGNVVGIEAAAWRYWGHSADDLSWAEAATLAVLPNSPSMIHLSRNRDALLAKRNRLLHKLLDRGIIDETTCSLAVEEPLPSEVQPLPSYAPHLVEYYHSTAHGKRTRTAIDLPLQIRLEDVMRVYNGRYSMEGISDIASVVVDVPTGDVIAYVGNVGYDSGREGAQVDIARSPRSTGSILKPLLYCAVLEEGDILPYTLVPDLPVNLSGFSPQNYDHTFSGAVSADEALARSLNVPSVHQLRKYGVERFKSLLTEAGMTTLNRSADNYGLSLILGGAEGKLLEITQMYASLGYAMVHGPFSKEKNRLDGSFPFHDRTAIWYTLDALKEVNRPDELDYKAIPSVGKIAWKTGTSFGSRDAWAVGVTPGYAVGVWVGNADGSGNPLILGAKTAGPVMLDIFNLLNRKGWFEEPYPDEYVLAEVCRRSGHLKGPYCNEVDTLFLPKNALRSEACPYHIPVTITSDGLWRCSASDVGAHTVSWFVLPAAMEWYYRSRHSDYTPLPPYRPGSSSSVGYVPMQFIYPESGAAIHIPKQIDGSMKGVVFNLAHSNSDAVVYWHLDENYLTCTENIHQIEVLPTPGAHRVTVVDNAGNTLSVSFSVTSGDMR